MSAEEWARRLRAGAQRVPAGNRQRWIREQLLDEIDEDDPRLDRLVAAIDTALGGVAHVAPTRRRSNHTPQTEAQASTRPPVDEEDRTAPFRFVTLAKPVPAPDAVRTANLQSPIPGGFSGTIDVEWAVETPMLIGSTERIDGTEVSVPQKLGGAFVVPGASLRGMLRSTMEIVTRARLSQVNKHHRYGVRDFDHILFADKTRRLAWDEPGDKPGSGWLRPARDGDPAKKDGDSDFVIEPCRKYLIGIRKLPSSFNGGKSTNDKTWHKVWLNTRLLDRYGTAGMLAGKIVNFDPTMQFALTSADEVEPVQNGPIRGTFVVSGHSPTAMDIDPDELDRQAAHPQAGDQKKRECVFVDALKPEPKRLKQSAFDRFHLINSKPGRNKRDPDGTYKLLLPTLLAAKRIPIFFAGSLDDQDGREEKTNRLDIGLTRLFKIGHEFSVGEVLAREQEQAIDPRNPDMVEALFGYVHEPADLPAATDPDRRGAARKGRVAFGFARLSPASPGRVQNRNTVTVAMAPRASFAPLYLNGRTKDWSAPDTRLAGRKRYFPRFATRQERAEAASVIRSTLESVQGTPDTASRLRFLEPVEAGADLVFTSRIRLHNVAAEEVGAVLWTLTHGGDPTKPYRHMLGRAKPAGAGQVRAKSITLALIGHDAAADRLLDQPEQWERPDTPDREGWTAGTQSLAPFLRAFEKHMQQASGDRAWPNVPDIKELLGAANPQVCNARIVATGGSATLPFPAGFKRVRDAAKINTRKPAPAPNQDRLLVTPQVATVVTPYRNPR